jgi:hypothetical protein
MLMLAKRLGGLLVFIINTLGFDSDMLDFYPFSDWFTGNLIFLENPHKFMESFLVNFELHNFCHFFYNGRMLRVGFVEHHELGILFGLWWNSNYLPQRLVWKVTGGIALYPYFLQFLAPSLLAHIYYS